MNYPTLNGHQCRGPGGDGRALHVALERAGWASFLTRDGERVDMHAITDLHQLAKDLANDHAPVAAASAATPRTVVGFYRLTSLAVAQGRVDAARTAARAAVTDIANQLADGPTVEEVKRQQAIATLSAEQTADAFEWRQLVGRSPRSFR